METTSKKIYWVVLEQRDDSLRGSREVKIGYFTTRERAEEVLAKSISTIAIAGIIVEEDGVEKGVELVIDKHWLVNKIVTELAYTMKNKDECKERSNNIVAAMHDEEFGVDMVYDMLTPNEAHGGIDDQMERDRSAHLIVKICNIDVTK